MNTSHLLAKLFAFISSTKALTLKFLSASLFKISVAISFIFSKTKALAINPKTYIFLGLQAVIVIGLFFILGYWPVVSHIEKITEDKNNKAHVLAGEKKIFEKYRNIKAEKDFNKALLNLSKSDSIYLLIDFKDSTVSLAIKGVLVHEVRLQVFSFDNGLKKLPPDIRLKVFEKPLQVISDESTIEKFPIVLKKAPKDTIEAQLTESAPAAPNQSDVFFSLKFSNNLIIEFHQTETDFLGDKAIVRQYFMNKRKQIVMREIDSLKTMQPAPYFYKITLLLPREEARSIYRGLPVKPFVLIRM